jgi:hypothetical protein
VGGVHRCRKPFQTMRREKAGLLSCPHFQAESWFSPFLKMR